MGPSLQPFLDKVRIMSDWNFVSSRFRRYTSKKQYPGTCICDSQVSGFLEPCFLEPLQTWEPECCSLFHCSKFRSSFHGSQVWKIWLADKWEASMLLRGKVSRTWTHFCFVVETFLTVRTLLLEFYAWEQMNFYNNRSLKLEISNIKWT